jgi:hypothetical protein
MAEKMLARTDAFWLYALNGGTPRYYVVGNQVYDLGGNPTFYICGDDSVVEHVTIDGTEERRVRAATVHAADGRPAYWIAGTFFYSFATRQPELYFDASELGVTTAEISWE